MTSRKNVLMATSPYANIDDGVSVAHWDVTNDTWVQTAEVISLPSMKKFLIKNNNKIHTLSDNGELLYPVMDEPLTQPDYEEWGVDDLDGYEQPVSKVKYEAVQSEQTETGSVYRYEIDKTGLAVKSVTIE